MFSFIFCLESLSQYNEEGLPIVEITEPYFSDDEEGAEKTETPTGLLPFSQKTAEEQAADRAILDRIAELEREDEERERRREAGEIVTSEEETSESEEEDYDDGESEDEHRPKALDSDEEYEEEVWEHSGNESDEDREIAQNKRHEFDGAAARSDGIDESPGEIRQRHIAQRHRRAQDHDGDDFSFMRQREAKHFPPQGEIHFAGEDIFFHGRWGTHWTAPSGDISLNSDCRSSASAPWICQSRRYSPSCATSWS